MVKVKDHGTVPVEIYGIDFSGAQDAGRKVWIASGATHRNVLQITDCFSAATLSGSGNRRDRCIVALLAFISGATNGVFGLDFPFGLPLLILKNLGLTTWLEFIQSFPAIFPNPEEFKNRCRRMADKELKRQTDEESRTPFSPYNLWLYKQTYYGINNIIRPLVENDRAHILPMQKAQLGKPWLLEICPRSTMNKEKIDAGPYKGKDEGHLANRRRILDYLENSHVLIKDHSLRDRIIQNTAGDAVDSVIAAFAVFKALRHPAFPFLNGRQPAYDLEGYLYA